MKSTIKKISVFLLALTLIITTNQFIGVENATIYEDDYKGKYITNRKITLKEMSFC